MTATSRPLEARPGSQRGRVVWRHLTYGYIAQQEVFGPVLVFMPYDDEDDAVRIANNSIYGLYGIVCSADTERATAVARRIRTGSMMVNGAPLFGNAPFGGYKQSGLGRECGIWGFEEFLEMKAISLPAN
ncbi:aldehyde dehydrogenase family protein [Streptomyces sp. NPDC102467]|uniref:aldehyde dehydrogenase family protein n=1 Tax=Streptomyces sp. NPDC102467 TaxID=3366179 RepID=UPI0038085EDB